MSNLQGWRWWQRLETHRSPRSSCDDQVRSDLDLTRVAEYCIHVQDLQLEHYLPLDVILDEWKYLRYLHSIHFPDTGSSQSTHPRFYELTASSNL